MARVADYSIVTDGWVVEANQDTISFEVPENVHTGSRSILGFMLEVYNLDDTTLTLRLNGEKVWTWKYSGGRRVTFFQEVIAAGVVKAGTNVFSFDSSSGDARFVQISDVVVWWQASI